MPKVFFENIHTKARYEVVRFNREEGTVTLLGKHGVPFDEKYSKDRFEEMGYRPVQGEAEAQAVPPAPPAPPAPPPPPTDAVPPPPPVPQPASA
jgi:hypothetical protein